MARTRSSKPPLGLVLVRLCIGAIFAHHGWTLLRSGGVDAQVVRKGVREAALSLNGLFAWWGETVLLYNPDAIAFLWRWGALVCGLCLLLGALTRPVGWIATFFLLNAYAFAPAGRELLFLLLLVCALACALSRAGRRMGLDPMFDQHLPSWLTWTRSQGGFLS
jgi:uncharacterized membrane protein YphA (DoxX/SURF4 family)